MASEGPLTSEAYIEHHLTDLTYGQKPDGSWGIAQSQEEISQMGLGDQPRHHVLVGCTRLSVLVSLYCGCETSND